MVQPLEITQATIREDRNGKAPGRAQRRHVREKATIDHLVRDVYEPKTPDEKHTERSPTTSTGLPVEDQVRKEWAPREAASRFFGE